MKTAIEIAKALALLPEYELEGLAAKLIDCAGTRWYKIADSLQGAVEADTWEEAQTAIDEKEVAEKMQAEAEDELFDLKDELGQYLKSLNHLIEVFDEMAIREIKIQLESNRDKLSEV